MDVLLRLKLVDLLDVDGETAGGVEATWAEVALEMLGLLVLHQNCGGFSIHGNGLEGMTNPSHLQTPSHSTSTKGGGSVRA